MNARPAAERRLKRVGAGKTEAAAREQRDDRRRSAYRWFLAAGREALGIAVTIDVEQTADGARINIGGDEAELFVRHRGEPLKALQHVVDMAFGRAFDDGSACSSMRWDTGRARTSSFGRWPDSWPRKRNRPALDQQLGPLNPYERRIVHMAVAEVPGVDTESVGDAFSKTVLISQK